MKVLLVKTSSMGDVIHTLPALTDAGRAIPNVRFDWMLEEDFAEIPTWHPLVEKVIPIAFRRWRKGLFSRNNRQEWHNLREVLQHQQYDLILDAQGLVKSAFLTYFAKGQKAGLDWASARESLASVVYDAKYTVKFAQHAIIRMRELFSQALNYPLSSLPPDYSVDQTRFLKQDRQNYLVFLHGTTWNTKLWPENYWIELAQLAAQAGYRIKISGGNAIEKARAERMAKIVSAIDVLPRLSITQMATLLANAKAAVAVDTGFGHLSAALNIPTLSLYGPTNPLFTGALGDKSIHMAAQFSCAPCLQRKCTFSGKSSITPACFSQLPPAVVWQRLTQMLLR